LSSPEINETWGQFGMANLMGDIWHLNIVLICIYLTMNKVQYSLIFQGPFCVSEFSVPVFRLGLEIYFASRIANLTALLFPFA